MYERVQNLITEHIINETPFTTRILMQELFGSEFNIDSREQREIVYGSIVLGRDIAAIKWDHYAMQSNGSELRSEIWRIKHYEADLIEEEKKTQDYKDFYHELTEGKFGKYTGEIIETLEDAVCVAIVFKNKMKAFSLRGDNFLISTYGANAIWYIPTWWKWNSRENSLYIRTIRMLQHQLKRAEKIPVALLSGRTTEEVKRLSTIVEAALTDQTSWQCPRCGIMNVADEPSCVNCWTVRS
jgi:hypothetical protein